MKRLIKISIFCALMAGFVHLFVGQSFAALVLPVVPISQHFAPIENGDSGAYDCTPSAYAMVLQTLQTEDKLKQGDFSYQTVRRTMRSVVTNSNEGIDLPIAVSLTPNLTNNQATSEIIQVDHTNWQQVLSQQLKEGKPVIVFLSDWNYLIARGSSKQHVIMVSGISDSAVTFIDPWDGNTYQAPLDTFAYAWGSGNLPWYGVTFTTSTFLLSNRGV